MQEIKRWQILNDPIGDKKSIVNDKFTNSRWTAPRQMIFTKYNI